MDSQTVDFIATDKGLHEVTPTCDGEDGYFPERALARWLHSKGYPSTVYAFNKVGARALCRAYRALVARLEPDAIVDGGTDILMFGDGAGLGTPEEDMVSLSAASQLDIEHRFVACIGFGVDTYHGVCHAHFLQNVATLEQDGAYLGAFSVPRASREGGAFLEAVAFAQHTTPKRPSIVNESIAAAIRGEFGDAQFTHRTSACELFINALMGIYFTFDLAGLVRRNLYLERLLQTETIFDVNRVIEIFRHEVIPRRRVPIPH